MHNLIAIKARNAIFLIATAFFILKAHGDFAPSQSLTKPSLPDAAIYDADPNHLWNRLFCVFYLQKIAFNNVGFPSYLHSLTNQVEERWVGPDVLDPPIGYHPKFLLEDASFKKCNAILDEFINSHGEKLIDAPLKKALLQRDLWAVFDVLAQAGQRPVFFSTDEFQFKSSFSPKLEEHRVLLEEKLAHIIRALALSRKEISELPDSYADAVKSGAFTGTVQKDKFNFLPVDLFTTNSGWREVVPAQFFKTNAPGMTEHALVAGGRSIFRAFVKQAELHASEPLLIPTNSAERFPVGTRFLLLREMICLDQNGRMIPSHIVESVQFRSSAPPKTFIAREVELSRTLLFQNQQGGLRTVTKGEPRDRRYENLGHLRVDEKGNASPTSLKESPMDLDGFPNICVQCHDQNLVSPVKRFASPERTASITSLVKWKTEQGKLDTLLKLAGLPTREAN